MKNRGILPDEYTFPPLLKSTSNLCDYKLGQCVHAQVIRARFECHGSVRIGLVELYTTYERIGDAEKVFDPMFDTDVIICNLMNRGFCKTGFLETENKKDGEPLELSHEMLERDFEPDDATLVTILTVCACLGDLDAGKWIHSYACSRGFQRDVIAVGNSLVDYYGKSGNLEAAWSIFNEMPHKNVVSWNAMVLGLAYNGKGELGGDLFRDEMIEKGVSPSDSTFTSVLACCAHAGLADRGLELFASVTTKFQLQPKLEHYGCVVDLLGRCGQETRRSAVKELINLEPWNSGNYVLLSNIYAEGGKWDEVEKVRLLVRHNIIRKTPGQSGTG
ncbi:hypothetical protein K1719_024965 [Acacia pycnantha]|nr:hypothetical protein K1719_024965 [Acacia pycnantha]